MARLASQFDFESGLGAYSHYFDYPFFQQRVAWIQERYPQTGNFTFAIIGCGWGYLLKHMIEANFANVWAMDLAQYCIDKAQQLFGPEIYNRIMLGDGKIDADWLSLKTLAGMSKNQRFDVGITEDLMGYCANDAEAVQFNTAMNPHTSYMLHIITCLKPGDKAWGDPADGTPGPNRDPIMLWHTQAYWKNLLQGSFILDTETWNYL